jgi:hypothetical protein
MAIGKSFKEFFRPKLIRATEEGLRATAVSTIEQLQEIGPYWDGYFYNAWDCLVGDVNIPADQEGSGKDFGERGTKPPPDGSFVPPADIKKGYTIGNRMQYRAVAMDLVPGRIKGGGNETAVQDWYTKHFTGKENMKITRKATTDGFKRGFKQ